LLKWVVFNIGGWLWIQGSGDDILKKRAERFGAVASKLEQVSAIVIYLAY